MAEIDYLEDYGVSESAALGAGQAVGKWANISGAVVSLALIAGLSVWGYKLLMRDVTGVPVVQAMDGAFRVAPEDPGGMRAPHQGLAVNRIAAVGDAGGPVDTVTLAPPPMALDADEDLTAPALDRMAQAVQGPASALPLAGADEDGFAAEGPQTGVPFDDSIDARRLADDAIADDMPGALATDLAVAEALSAPEDDIDDFLASEDDIATTEEAPIETADGVAVRSPRPALRPADLTDRVTPQAIATVAADATRNAAGPEVSVDDLAIGTRLVQLGAFASPEVAREEWVRIAGRFPDYFDGKRRVVQRAASGGKTFYRLRAEGFDDLADTRRFCTALVAGSADCIPVELR